MKKSFFAVLLTFFLFAPNASAVSVEQLACEAIMCLSTISPPGQCFRSLKYYYSIDAKRLKNLHKARVNFLKLCVSFKGDVNKVVAGAPKKPPIIVDPKWPEDNGSVDDGNNGENGTSTTGGNTDEENYSNNDYDYTDSVDFTATYGGDNKGYGYTNSDLNNGGNTADNNIESGYGSSESGLSGSKSSNTNGVGSSGSSGGANSGDKTDSDESEDDEDDENDESYESYELVDSDSDGVPDITVGKLKLKCSAEELNAIQDYTKTKIRTTAKLPDYCLVLLEFEAKALPVYTCKEEFYLNEDWEKGYVSEKTDLEKYKVWKENGGEGHTQINNDSTAVIYIIDKPIKKECWVEPDDIEETEYDIQYLDINGTEAKEVDMKISNIKKIED